MWFKNHFIFASLSLLSVLKSWHKFNLELFATSNDKSTVDDIGGSVICHV